MAFKGIADCFGVCSALNLSVLLLCFTCVSVRAVIQTAVIDKQSGKLLLVDGFREDFVAWANFTDAIKTTGWSYLEVTTSSEYNDSIQAYAAGAVEAAVTSQLIYKHWMNTLMDYCGPFKPQSDYCDRLKAFINTNLQWVQDQIEKLPDSLYWYQVRLALLQLKGLEDGYNDDLSFPTGPISFNPFGFLLFQMGGDLEDLESALNKSSETRPLGSGSCSALIKLLPNNKDLLVSHDTWNTYQSMLRIIKKYTFPFKMSPLGNELIPGETQAFSSYPGSIFSGDDFYILSSGLVTLETTIGNSNPALWDFVQPTGTVMEWLRNIVANRLAVSGKEWAEVFSQYNSGTYNNQWMIIDYKHFSPGKAGVKEELFVVLEQIPGMVVYEDKTKELMRNGYWASYNIPYYVDIFNASGCNELVDKFGPWFSFDKSPRAQIFRRNQTTVTDIESMIRLMRYNNFNEDPLSKCEECDPHANAENAISARSDLNPANGTYPFGALTQRQHGGTDMKLTSYDMLHDYGMVAVSGPTWDQVPPFQWSTSPYKDLLHMGHPDKWTFNPIKVIVATLMMVFWQPITNLREYVTNKPPGVTFFFCLLALALSFICLSVYSYTHTLPNPDVAKDWNHLLTSMAQHHLCEKNHTSFTTIVPEFPNEEQKTMEVPVAFLYVRVPLILASKSKDISESVLLHTSFTSSQLQLEGNETYIVTIDFTANGSNSCLTITAPSHLLSISPVPPACLQTTNIKEAVYAEARTVITPAQRCYSLLSMYDPTLQVMLTKEDQLVAVRHLVEVAVVLLGVCLILCLSVSLTHSPSQRHRLTEQDLQDPLIDN